MSLLLVIGMSIALLVGTSGAASAATCRDTSYIPSINAGAIVRSNGTVFQIRKTIINRAPAVLAWENGRYLGTSYVPASFYGRTVGAINKIQPVYETRFGRVVQVQKVTQVLRVCDPSWSIRF